MHKQLKEEEYYSDVYDLQTIEECLRFKESWRKACLEKPSEKMIEQLSEAERLKCFSMALNMSLYGIKGERYRSKASVIQEWMNSDRKRDELFQNAQAPRNIRCPNCIVSMSIILKELYEFSGKPTRVLFFFECPECKKRKGCFDNGEEFKSKPELCPKCDQAIKTSILEKGRTIVWAKNCPACDFNETEIDDLDKSQADRVAREQRKKELLQKHRTEFCLSAKEGEEYLQSLLRLERLAEIFKEAEVRRTDPDYKEAESLNKWTIAELQNVLSKTLEKEQYLKLSLDKPEIDKYVIAPFTVQDFDSSRKEKDSVYKLQRIIKKTLSNSNWRLMSEGISYRLGYLSGRLKGYEREDDLVQLIKQEKPK